MPKQKTPDQHTGVVMLNADDTARQQEKTMYILMIKETVEKTVQNELQEPIAELRKLSQVVQRAYPEEATYYDSVGCSNDDYKLTHHYENGDVLGGVNSKVPSYKKVRVENNRFLPPPKEGKHRKPPKANKKPHTADERYCLAKALQKNIMEIVSGITLADGGILDELRKESCLSSDECADIENKLTETDKARMLVSKIKGKSKQCLDRLLGEIKKQNKSIFEHTMDTFRELKKMRLYEKDCVFCKIKSRVDVKLIFDRLWCEEILSDRCYNAILYDNRPPGNQNEHWEALFDMLETEEHYKILATEIGKNGHYNYLSDELLKSIELRDWIFCSCQRKINISNDPCRESSSSNNARSSASSEENIYVNSVQIKALGKKKKVPVA